MTGAAAISSATGGQVPTLVEADCERWSYEVVTYPGITKDDVAARVTKLPFCTAHTIQVDSTTTPTSWECYFSGKILNVAFYPDKTPVSVRVEVPH